MRVAIGDISLYFDVDGAHLVPDGPSMAERPTIIALHGGPGRTTPCSSPCSAP
jgi:hypothetical protein